MTTPPPSPPPTLETFYACRLCRQELFRHGDLEPHTAGRHALPARGARPRASSASCQSLFLAEPPAWLLPVEGRVRCPNARCGARLGSLCWSGSQCSCGTWVVPAIQVLEARVDAKQRRKRAERVEKVEMEGAAETKEIAPTEEASTGKEEQRAGPDAGAEIKAVVPEMNRPVTYRLRSAIALVHNEAVAERLEAALSAAEICEMVKGVTSTKQLRRYLLERGYNPYSLVVVAKAAGDKAFEIAAGYATKAGVLIVRSAPPSVVADVDALLRAAEGSAEAGARSAVEAAFGGDT